MNNYLKKILIDNGFTVSQSEESITKTIWRSKSFI